MTDLFDTTPEPGRQLPMIAGVEITTDAHGRFNLNALHRASGGEKSKQPSNWIRLEATQALIAELESHSSDLRSAPTSTVNGGSAPGTFAHELLAIDYAGWISPAFRLQVHQVFIDFRTGKLASAAPIDLAAPAMSAALSREVRLSTRMFGKMAKDMGLVGNQALLSVCRGVQTMTGVNPMAAMGLTHIEAEQNDDMLNVSDLGRRVGCSAQEMNLKLIGRGLQTAYRDRKGNKKYELTEEGRTQGGTWHDAQKVQGGRPIRQLLWPARVADLFGGEGAA